MIQLAADDAYGWRREDGGNTNASAVTPPKSSGFASLFVGGGAIDMASIAATVSLLMLRPIQVASNHGDLTHENCRSKAIALSHELLCYT